MVRLLAALLLLFSSPATAASASGQASCAKVYANVQALGGTISGCNLVSADKQESLWLPFSDEHIPNCRKSCAESAVSFLEEGRTMLCCFGAREPELLARYQGNYCPKGRRLERFDDQDRPVCANVCDLIGITKTFDASGKKGCLAFCERYGLVNWASNKICSRCLFNGVEIKRYPAKWPPKCREESAAVGAKDSPQHTSSSLRTFFKQLNV